jgi:hypothetical protein
LKINNLVYNIMALTLIYIFFLLFKGPTNILNALFVPLTIFLFSFKNNLRERLVFYGVVIIFCALFFNIQIFFVIAYCIIAAILRIISVNNFKRISSFFTLTLIISFLFYLGIVFTDLVFQTKMNSIMMTILNNNIIIYLMMIIIEASIVSISLLFFTRLFKNRIRLIKPE